ncbi:Monocarboxylate transporter 2 [Holothuria leucospilota]|uniref:Monocarboxylate transporter 2 n=1 Tax=Holothuria leucospilota TaxID=206669 RepID=A0A9Q1CS95_HOLLE|nr:Monocarboxylate transporter 2 [Holothuria leucospilota]
MEKAIVFFGWSLRVFLSYGCLKSNGVILSDIVQRLGTTNSVVGWAFSLQHGVSYLVGPLASLLLRVFTRRQVAVFGGCLVGTSYIYCGLCLKSVWQLFFAYTVAGIGLGFHMFAGYLNFCEHFYDNLGTAVSVASLCNFLGLATLPLFLQYLKTSFGLDNGLILFGVFLLNLTVSAIAVTKPVRNFKQIQAVEAKQPDKEETCPFTKANDVDKNKHVNEEKNNLLRYLQACRAMFNHENLAVFMALEGLMFYIYMSWGLFLVSVGTSAGLNPDQAVLLSSAGGTGGLFGKLAAVELFRTERMNPFTSTLLPLIGNAVCFTGCALVRSYYPILLFTFICGACIGVNSSGMFGLLPTMVCKSHFHQAFVTASFIDGIAMQLAGFTSGLISDITGSATNVFVFNALLSIAGLPLVLQWACRCSYLNQFP